MKNPVFTGSCVAIVTPFKGDRIDFEKLAELIEFHIQKGTSAITVCGTTGEASTQTTPEHLECIKFAVECAAGRIKIIAGTGSNDTAHGIEMCTTAESYGADALLLVTPYYNKTTQHGLIKHYTVLADSVNIPVILYNVPSRTGVTIAEETYLELSKHPRINGTKEASGNFSAIARTIAMCGDELNVWSGNDDQCVPMMALGAKGVISVVANIAPEYVQKMCTFALDGDYKSAARMQTGMMELNDALFIEVNPVPIKTAMNLMGMGVGDLRLPLYDMTPAHVEVLKKSLVNFGFKLN